jgi:integrase
MRVREVRIRPHVRDGVPTGRWVVDIPPGFTTTGKRERPLVDDELSARRMKANVEGSRVPVETTSRAPVITTPQLVTFWHENEMAKVRSGKKKASSLETNLHQLEPVAAYLGSLDLKNLTARHLQDYQGHRRTQGMQPETINSEMGTFVQVEKWAVEAGWLEKVVTTTRVPVPPKRHDVLTEEEYRRVMEALPERLRPLIRFLAETGCRWGEAAQMLWLNIDLEAGWAEVALQGEWSPKTAYSLRRLYLSPDLVAELRRRRNGSQYVFTGRDGVSPVTTARRAFKSVVEKAAIMRGERRARITIKTLRASFATWAAESGVRERVLQDLLGHAPGSRVTRRHYEQVQSGMAQADAAKVWARLSEGPRA